MASFTAFLASFLAVMSVCRADPVEKCPRGCQCTQYTEVHAVEVRVDCVPPEQKQIGAINHVPDDLPPDLTQLLLDNNVIDHLSPNAFSNYPKLKTLSLRGNKIKTIESGTFVGLRQLKNLDLSSNVIETIDNDVFKDVPKLESLNLNKNRLTKISSFEKFPAITDVSLDFNNFTNCTFPAEMASEKLQSVSIAGCACTSISAPTFANLASSKLLTRLVLSGTQVTKIAPDTFAQLESLEDLDISNNRFLDWTEIQKIKYPPRLKKLNLDSLKNVHSVLNTAYIEFLPDSLDMLRLSQCGFNGTMPDFRHLTNLTFLYIEGNGFTSLPDGGEGYSGFPLSIEHIFARNNKIQRVPAGAFAGLRNLQSVDLCYSGKIKPFSRDAFGKNAVSVTDLLLTQALGEFPQGLLPNLPNLQRLVLDENEFMQLDNKVRDDFDALANLQKLDLTGNQLRDLPPSFFKKMTSLTHLYLNDNFLGDRIAADVDGLFFSGLKSLYLLDLEENDIGDLPPKLFSQTGTDLATLSLLGNKLTRFPSEALANMQKLRLVNLDGNEVRVLSGSQFGQVPPKCVVNLWSNPIECGCDNYEFFRWMEQTKAGTDRPDIKEVICRTPVELNNKPPPPLNRLTASCSNSAGSTAVIAFLVVICMIVVVVLVTWFGARKLRHYFPYKRLGQPSGRTSGGNAHLVVAAPNVHMSGLDDTEETFQM